VSNSTGEKTKKGVGPTDGKNSQKTLNRKEEKEKKR